VIAAAGELLVVTGPPGAGKSSVARALADGWEPSALVEGDAFFRFLARGAIDPWLPESHTQNETVTRAAGAAAGRMAAGGYATVYDGVVGPWFLPAFLDATGLDHLHYAVLFPPVERCVTGVRTRLDHGFTDEPATRHMHASFGRALSDLDPRHLVADPPDGVDAAAALVQAEFEAGRLRHTRPRG
jgi:energy-coupling factor transporter ATP-binding protein EcfA2